MNKQFCIWAFGDAHVSKDILFNRESLADAIRQSEQGTGEGGSGFGWDLAIDVGDNSAGQKPPEADEGRELLRQYAALTGHPREAIYSVCGNHDRNHLSQPPADWFRHWVDPLGEYPETSGVDILRRPFPVEGTWERYSFRIGNILVLMMSDINEPSQTKGRGDLGGNPGGVVSGETFEWWRQRVEDNPDCIIMSVHHYMLKETTLASGEWEGVILDEEGGGRCGYHGYFPEGSPKGASYLYWVDSQPDAQRFENYLADNPGAVDLWLGGHTHPRNPDDRFGGKGITERNWGVNFLNVGALTKHHGGTYGLTPSSRLLTFTEGSDQVRLQCYLHTSDYAPQGWYAPAERMLKLREPFVMPAAPCCPDRRVVSCGKQLL